MAKAQLGLQLAGTVKGNKNSFLMYVNSERSKDNTDPVLDEAGHLTNWDGDQAERLNTFFAPVFNSNNHPWVPEPGELEDNTWRKYKLPVNSELVCDFLIQLDAHKFMSMNLSISPVYGTHPRVLKDLVDVITRSLSTTFQQSEDSTGKM